MDRFIRTLWRQSHVLGLPASVTLAVAWLVSGGAIARFGLPQLAQYSALFWFCLVVVSLVVAFGALISFWILASHIEFRKRGYQVNWLTADQWAYEERRNDGSVERLPLSRKMTGDGYPAPCTVYVQSRESWDECAPVWARGRRTEIMSRIAEQFGGRVQFCDIDLPPSVDARPGDLASLSDQSP